MKSKLHLAAAVAALSLATAGAALAEDSDELATATAKISLADAVTAAEQHLGGKAASAEIKQEDGKLVFEVDVINGQEVKDVVIDAATGEVLAVQAETDD
jgi:uncharacterized membrane protein YkoI